MAQNEPRDLSTVPSDKLGPVLDAQRAWRSAHRRVVRFRAESTGETEIMRIALEQEQQALAQIARLDPTWAAMLRAEYGIAE